MGRQQYLTRLALGRSAFQDHENADADSIPGVADNHDVPQPGNGDQDAYVQQYDIRGRPMNPATEARTAELRRAQNSVLALVGVVEDRDRSHQTNEREARRLRQERQDLLEDEQSLGEELDLLRDLLEPLLTWWPDCVTKRIQIGLYDVRQPFTAILKTEWATLRAGGLKGAYATLLSGSAAMFLFAVLRVCYVAGIAWTVEHISESLWSKDRRVKSQKRILGALEGAAVALILCGDLLLLPLSYYATAQALSVAPAFPLLPPAQSFLPWHPLSLHYFGWKPIGRLPILRSLSSPASLLLGQAILIREAYSDAQTPIASGFTSFEYPAVGETSMVVEKPKPTRDPLGWVLYQAYEVRSGFLAWCGWNVITLQRTASDVEHENDISVEVGEKGSTVASTHRSTQLAHLAPQYLAEAIDGLLTRLLILPFETIVLRVAATSYLSSPLPKSTQGIYAASNLSAPFAGGIVRSLRAPWLGGGGWRDIANYMSKMGLSLALHVAVQTTVFVGIYGLVRWRGVRRFQWGRPGASTTKRSG